MLYSLGKTETCCTKTIYLILLLPHVSSGFFVRNRLFCHWNVDKLVTQAKANHDDVCEKAHKMQLAWGGIFENLRLQPPRIGSTSVVGGVEGTHC